MTTAVSQALNAGSNSDASASTVRKAVVGRSAFELLLNLELASQMPETANADRFAEHVKAQERRGGERTGRSEAQQAARSELTSRGGATTHARSDAAGNTTGTTTGTAANSAPAGENRSDQGAQGKGESSLFIGSKQTQGQSQFADSETKSEGGRDDASASGQRRQPFAGALGGVLNPSSSARSAGTSNQSAASVSAVKAGVSGSPQVGMHGLRDSGRAAASRGKSQSLANRPRSFHVDQQKVLAQVGRGLAAALKREGGEITLRLRPETLGELKIKLEMSDGRVNAIFRADNDSARQLLESSLDALKSSLEAKGLRVDRLFVESPDDPGHKQNGSQKERNDHEQTPGGDREASDDGDRPRQSPGMAPIGAAIGPQADAEAPVEHNAVSDARIAEDSTQQSGLVPGEDEMLVRVRLDAVA